MKGSYKKYAGTLSGLGTNVIAISYSGKGIVKNLRIRALGASISVVNDEIHLIIDGVDQAFYLQDLWTGTAGTASNEYITVTYSDSSAFDYRLIWNINCPFEQSFELKIIIGNDNGGDGFNIFSHAIIQ